MGVLVNLAIYGAYLLLFGAVAFGIYESYHHRGKKKIVEDFFSYVAKGRRRVPALTGHILFFFGLQLIFFLPVLYAPQSIFLEVLVLTFLVTFGIFYTYAYYSDRVKKHRHNGIQIGYEYPHPSKIGEDRRVISFSEDSDKITTVAYAGSKGIYDLQLLTQPNPHIMIIGESGVGKSTTQETLLIRANERFGMPFLIIDWSGSYKKLGTYVNMWKVPDTLHINPFALRGMKPERRAGIASEVLQISLELTPMQAQRVRDLLNELYKTTKEPTIDELYQAVMQEAELERYKEMKLQLRYVANKLSQAFEVFGTEPDQFWNSYDSTCGIVELEGLTDAEKTLVTLALIQRITEEFGDAREKKGVRLNIALDDAYRAIATYYGKETPIARIVREGRKYGFASGYPVTPAGSSGVLFTKLVPEL